MLSAIRADSLFLKSYLGWKKGTAGLTARPGIFHALQTTALAFPVADGIAEKLQLGGFLEIGYGKDILEGGLEAHIFPLLGQQVHLQELIVGLPLNLEKVGQLKDRLDFGKVDSFPIIIMILIKHGSSLKKEFDSFYFLSLKI